VSPLDGLRQRLLNAGTDARPIRAAVKELHRRHPRASEQQIARLLSEQLETDGDLLEACAVYLTHDAMSAVPDQRRPSRPPRRRSVSVLRARRPRRRRRRRLPGR
jgi:hypothetical protein